ncbi:MAG: LysM peptidoglycan-binding domain-containing protein [Ruminiclostridium sp.]|nr:LysM peptidoglycan-binding domain-containing protein [Ruminiclostridium sp.]
MHLKKIKKLCLIITLIVAMLLPFYEASAVTEPEYVLYTVRAGDTLHEIAKKYDTTVEALRLENGITDSNIITGQVLRIKPASDYEVPVNSGQSGEDTATQGSGQSNPKPGETVSAERPRSGVTLDVRDADIRDVLSTLAMLLKRNIIYTEESIRVSLSVQNVTPAKALEILTQSTGLISISDGNLILVGSSARINQNYYNLMPITRFSLNYLTPEQINAQVEKLEIPVQKIILDSTQKFIWAQGTPQALAKMSELIAALDREESIDPITLQPVTEFKLNPIELQYVESAVLDTLINQLEIPCKTIIFASNPWTLWVEAEEDAMKDIMTLVASVDILDNYVPEPIEEEEEEEVVIDTTRIEAKKMMNITSARLMPLIQDLDIPVKVIAIDSSGYNIWMRGDQQSINLMNDLINRLDNYFSRDDVNFFIFTLENLRASTAMEKLEFLGLQDVRVMSLNYPQYSRDLLIACPSDRINDVRNVLKKLDLPGTKVRVIVDSSSHSTGKSRLEARRDLIVALTGTPKESFKVSDNISKTTTPLYLLWVEETPDNVTLIRNVLASMDSITTAQDNPSED